MPASSDRKYRPETQLVHAGILRSQFGEILNAGGPERLLKILREKNAAGEPADLPLAGGQKKS